MDLINAFNTDSTRLEPISGQEQSISNLTSKTSSANRSEEESIAVAKKFESILFNQMINEMKNTIGQWGEEKDGASQQVHGLFWSQLGQNLGESGGIGFWQEIHQNMFNGNDAAPATSELEESI